MLKGLKPLSFSVLLLVGQYHACAALEPQVLPKQMLSLSVGTSTFSGIGINPTTFAPLPSPCAKERQIYVATVPSSGEKSVL